MKSAQFSLAIICAVCLNIVNGKSMQALQGKQLSLIFTAVFNACGVEKEFSGEGYPIVSYSNLIQLHDCSETIVVYLEREWSNCRLANLCLAEGTICIRGTRPKISVPRLTKLKSGEQHGNVHILSTFIFATF